MLREPASPVSAGEEGESDSGAERVEGMDALRERPATGHGRPQATFEVEADPVGSVVPCLTSP